MLHVKIQKKTSTRVKNWKNHFDLNDKNQERKKEGKFNFPPPMKMLLWYE